MPVDAIEAGAFITSIEEAILGSVIFQPELGKRSDDINSRPRRPFEKKGKKRGFMKIILAGSKEFLSDGQQNW